jgi:CubicO group peptidase (beta-lactamase class C family)
MRSFRRPACALLALVLAAAQGRAQGPVPEDLDAWVARAMSEFAVPGLSVTIVKDGKVAVAKGHGVRKLGDEKPVTDRTLFAIASNTKAFTAAALAMLVDEGKIAWDDPAWKRLPGFQMHDPYVAKELTIRDMLSHRSGLGQGQGDLLFWPKTNFTRDEIVHRLRFMKPASSFRSRYAYSNLMFVAAGQVIPAVTGKSWDEFVQQRILDPLGMKDTRTAARFEDGADYAWPHCKRGRDRVEPSALVMGMENAGPTGSMLSNARDIAKWMILQLDRGKLAGGDARLFSEAASREMWSPQTIVPIRENPPPLEALQPRFLSYGLGWFLRDYHGRKLVTHSGGVTGYVSRVLLVPEENLGVAIFTNAEEGGAYDAIVWRVVDRALGVPPTDWIAVLKAARDQRERDAAAAAETQRSARAAGTKPSLPLDRYAGEYDDAWYGAATIRWADGRLAFSMDGTPGMAGELEHWQHDTFRTRFGDRTMEDAFVTFALGPGGAIEQFKMIAVSPTADFSFDYHDLLFRPVAKKAESK